MTTASLMEKQRPGKSRMEEWLVGGKVKSKSAKLQDCAGAAATERLRPAGSFGRGRSIPFGQDGDHQPFNQDGHYQPLLQAAEHLGQHNIR